MRRVLPGAMWMIGNRSILTSVRICDSFGWQWDLLSREPPPCAVDGVFGRENHSGRADLLSSLCGLADWCGFNAQMQS